MSLTLAALGGDLLRRLPGARSQYIAGGALMALWLGTSVLMLQTDNQRARRAGLRTETVTAALSRVVAPAEPATMFVVAGLSKDPLGAGPGLSGRSVLLYGLTEALRLRVGDDFLDVEHGDRRHAELVAFRRPVVFLEWDEESQTFRRAWQSF